MRDRVNESVLQQEGETSVRMARYRKVKDSLVRDETSVRMVGYRQVNDSMVRNESITNVK